MSSNAIEVKDLTKKFGSFVSVDSVTFAVEKGTVFGFLGSNGAGKSTTIKMLCGMLEPTSGDAFVSGYSIVKDPEKVKLNIGYMSQRFSLYNDLTVEENINFFGGIYGLNRKELSARKDWALETAQLQDRKHVLTASLPGGIKQRLSLATSLLHKPGIVFLDEPTSGVDPISRRAFWELIHTISGEGTTVFVTTHYLEEAEYCNAIYFIDAGKIVAGGTPDSLKKDIITDRLAEIFCSQPEEARAVLEKQSWAYDVTFFGSAIHTFIRTSDITEQNIYDTLRSALPAAQIDSIAFMVPSLEDVFIHLLEKNA